MGRFLLWTAVGLVVLVIFLVIGLRIEPRPFPAYSGEPGTLEYVVLPADLPAPVDRFYRAVYGPEVDTRGVPVITSAVISGRATLKFGPVAMPGRFRFTHVAGQDYRHYIETTFFGIPLFKVNETYIGGRGRQELPVGTVEDDPSTNRSAALGMWAETSWFPAVYLTDPRVRWEPVDAYTALLHFPYQEGEEVFVARFDPDTNLLTSLEAMRNRDPGDSPRILWFAASEVWGEVDGHVTTTRGSATWMDMGKPWAVFITEEMVLNADVREYVLGRGL